MKSILHTVDIHAAPEIIFDALATQEGLSHWWTTRVKADVRPGGLVAFAFMPVFNPRMEITAIDKPRGLAWRCVGGHEPWFDDTFAFDIQARDAGAALLFRHDYARELGDEEYGRYNFNWGYYLNSLKRLCETGNGTPFDSHAE